ncbi:hypothetical protein VTI28DRAFT_2616 [Corynascus sepedonium]
MAAFHPFPRLPFELRARIWELTVEPRTVEVRVYHSTPPRYRKWPRRGWGRRNTLLSSLTPVPAILQTCREARNLGLYKKEFSRLSTIDQTRYVWLNLEIDMISIESCRFDNFKPVARLIRRLRFKGNNGSEAFYYFESRELRNFVNAKEIHVVCEDTIESWHGAGMEHPWPCGMENVLFIDPYDGRRMRSADVDKMCDEVLARCWEAEGYDYYTGEPLNPDSEE